MFERLAVIDTDADEATLVECIAELEHLKCVAAAGQVRLAAALDQKGWRVTAAGVNGVHTAEFVTPTGARHRSKAPPLPGVPMIAVSEVEVRVGIELAGLHAA